MSANEVVQHKACFICAQTGLLSDLTIRRETRYCKPSNNAEIEVVPFSRLVLLL